MIGATQRRGINLIRWLLDSISSRRMHLRPAGSPSSQDCWQIWFLPTYASRCRLDQAGETPWISSHLAPSSSLRRICVGTAIILKHAIKSGTPSIHAISHLKGYISTHSPAADNCGAGQERLEPSHGLRHRCECLLRVSWSLYLALLLLVLMNN